MLHKELTLMPDTLQGADDHGGQLHGQPLFQPLHPHAHMQTIILHKLGFNQNYYTVTSMLINIVLCGKFPWTKFTNYKCFDMKAPLMPHNLQGVRDHGAQFRGRRFVSAEWQNTFCFVTKKTRFVKKKCKRWLFCSAGGSRSQWTASRSAAPSAATASANSSSRYSPRSI